MDRYGQKRNNKKTKTKNRCGLQLYVEILKLLQFPVAVHWHKENVIVAFLETKIPSPITHIKVTMA